MSLLRRHRQEAEVEEFVHPPEARFCESEKRWLILYKNLKES